MSEIIDEKDIKLPEPISDEEIEAVTGGKKIGAVKYTMCPYCQQIAVSSGHCFNCGREI